jgi:hypothetical protein
LGGPRGGRSLVAKETHSLRGHCSAAGYQPERVRWRLMSPTVTEAGIWTLWRAGSHFRGYTGGRRLPHILYNPIRDDVETFGVRSGCVLTAFADNDFSGPQVTIRGGPLGSGQPNWVVLKNEFGYQHMHEAVGSVTCQCSTGRPSFGGEEEPQRPQRPQRPPPSDKPRRCREVSQSACAVAFDESDCDGGTKHFPKLIPTGMTWRQWV